MCMELGKEKDMLRELLLLEQSKSGKLIRRLESEVNTLPKVCSKDEKYIEELEAELRNHSLKIGYLQDQLNLRNVEANCVGEHVHSLELKLAETGKLYEKVDILRKDLMKSDSERLFLMRELERREEELLNSTLCIEKLEATISSIALESQCEIESLRLDLEASEQRFFKANKFNEQASNEIARMAALTKQCGDQFQEAQKMISYLETENKALHEKLVTSERSTVLFCRKIEEHLDQWLKNNPQMGFYLSSGSDQSLCGMLGSEIPAAKNMCIGGEVLGSFLTKLAAVTACDDKFKENIENMSHRIRESELLVKQLKDELIKEKLKAKEEAEDLTQEMAEFRYQIADMLEQECKRRAYIEKVSLHRIKELETEVQKERRKSWFANRHCEAEELAEARPAEEVENVKSNLADLMKVRTIDETRL